MPVATAALAVGASVLPNTVPSPSRSLDVAGAAALTGGLTALSVALMQARSWGWRSAPTVGLFVAATLSFAAFARVESRSDHPLVSLRLLGNRQLLGAVVAAGGMRFVVLGSLVFSVLYVQVILGMTPLVSGLAILPGTPCPCSSCR